MSTKKSEFFDGMIEVQDVLSYVLPEEIARKVAFACVVSRVRDHYSRVHDELTAEHPFLTVREKNVAVLKNFADYYYAERIPELEEVDCFYDNYHGARGCVPCATRERARHLLGDDSFCLLQDRCLHFTSLRFS